MKDFQNISRNFLFWIFLFVGVSKAMASGFPGDTLPPLKMMYTTPFLFEDDCDVCGCSGNGGSMGYGTAANNNFVGVRYIYQQYRSRDGIFNNSPWINENFNTVQVWSRLPLGKRFLVNAMLPYHFHHRQFTDGTEQKINGLGDATLMGFYKLLAPNKDSMSMMPEKWYHTVRMGGGVKAPTGEYNAANNAGSVNPSFQLGTGSWDYILAADYSVQKGAWGANVMFNYTFKSENSAKYHFGDQMNYGLDVYRSIAMGKSVGITPSVGVAGERFAENLQYNQPIVNTKGDVLFSKFGVEASYTNWALGINAMLPLQQNLNGGMVEVKNRMGVYLNFNL